MFTAPAYVGYGCCARCAGFAYVLHGFFACFADFAYVYGFVLHVVLDRAILSWWINITVQYAALVAI